MKTKEKKVCAQCGSLLVVISTNIRQSANPLYPITEIKYRCTNDICQAESDKKLADIARLRLEREEKTRKLKDDFSKTQVHGVSQK